MKSIMKINPMKFLALLLLVFFCTEPRAACKDALISTQSLMELDLKELMDVEIVSTVSKKEELAIEAPAVMSVIQCDEIERFGGNNLTEVLERATNLYMTGTATFPQNSISMRGDLNSFSKHILLLFDGRPIREGQTGGTVSPFLLSFPLSMVERIEILRDPGSVLYGSSAYVGVINVIPKRPTKEGTQGSVTVKGGSLNTKAGEGHFFWKKEEADLTLAANYFVEDGWTARGFDEKKIYGQGNYGEENVSVMAAGHYKGFKFDSFWLDSKLDTRGSTWPMENSDHRWIYNNLGYTENWNEHQRTEFNGTVNQMNVEMQTSGPAFADANSSLIEATHFYTGENWAGLIGGTANLMVGEVHTNNLQGEVVSREMPQYEKLWYTLYSQIDYDLWKNLKLTVGGQAVKAGHIDWQFVPRVGLTYHHETGWGFKTLYGEAYRAAYVNENNIEIKGLFKGNPNLTPEMIKTADIQIFYRKQNYQFALTYYRSLQQELIISVLPTATTLASNTNGNEMTFDGVEFESKVKLFDERLLFISSLAYQRNERNGLEQSTTVPDWLGKVGVSYDFDFGFSAGLFHNFSSRPNSNKLLNPNVMEVNPIAQPINLMTLKLSANLKKYAPFKVPLILSFYTYNLLDSEVNLPDFSSTKLNTLPQRADRSFYFGVEYNF